MMLVRRGNVPESRFTLLGNSVWDDRTLTSHAVRILGYLLSKPDGWDTNREKIMRDTGISEHHYRIAWDALIARKYVHQWREGSGKWFVIVTSLVEESHVTESQLTGSLVAGSHVTDLQVLERRKSTKKENNNKKTTKKGIKKRRVVRRSVPRDPQKVKESLRETGRRAAQFSHEEDQ